MYGLIHTALRDMVTEGFGEDVWLSIFATSEVDDDSFLTMRSYNDETTLALVAAAAEVLDLSVEQSLHAFGHFWITKFAPDEYGMLLDHTGQTPFDFLKNLDELHDRISTVFTEFKPPSFKVEKNSDGAISVTYRSVRVGLTPFVVGIMEGLNERFDEDIEIVSVVPVEVPVGEQTTIELKVG